MMEKRGVEESDLRASREMELRQIKMRLRQIESQDKNGLELYKSAELNAELNELTSRAEALESVLRADE